MCSVDGCDRAHYARGWCHRHYKAWLRNGTVEPRRSLDVRLWGRLRQAPNGCLEWPGATDHNGYGKIHYEGRTVQVHRLVWTLTYGPLPRSKKVCHSCDNPLCCNLGHLFVGTQHENQHDAIEKGRHTAQQYEINPRGPDGRFLRAPRDRRTA